MEVWMNRHQEFGFSLKKEHDKEYPFNKNLQIVKNCPISILGRVFLFLLLTKMILWYPGYLLMDNDLHRAVVYPEE